MATVQSYKDWYVIFVIPVKNKINKTTQIVFNKTVLRYVFIGCTARQ